jgi:uncharacterized protein YceH (UPF0502 family)
LVRAGTGVVIIAASYETQISSGLTERITATPDQYPLSLNTLIQRKL